MRAHEEMAVFILMFSFYKRMIKQVSLAGTRIRLVNCKHWPISIIKSNRKARYRIEVQTGTEHVRTESNRSIKGRNKPQKERNYDNLLSVEMLGNSYEKN